MNGSLAVIEGKLFIGWSDGLVYRYDLTSAQHDLSFATAVPIDNMAFTGRDYCVSQGDANVYCYTVQLSSCPAGDDCNDENAAVNPGATEICDCIDNNCNGLIDEGAVCNTVAQCGACNTPCVIPNGTPACPGAVCAVASCNPGYGDCDGLASDGCEALLAADTANCGACGHACAVANAKSRPA